MADHRPGPSAFSPPPPDRELYTIPLRSSWFRWDDVHDIERRALAEFFDSPLSISRTPRVYKEYRDFIINKYREDPSRRLTFTEIRKSLVGDVSLLRKVFDFLDSWGLINFSATKEEGEDPAGGLPEISVEEGPPGGLKVVAFPIPTKGLELSSRPLGDSGTRAVGVGGAGASRTLLSSYTDVFANTTALNGVVCGHCGESCTEGSYVSNKGGLAVCTKCFNEKFQDRKTEFVFECNDITEGTSVDWTDLETLHLLESVIAKRNDWALVSDQARRSKLDCVAKLIQLPFGEHMLNSIGEKNNYKHLVNGRVKEPSSEHFDKEGGMVVIDSENYASGFREKTNEDGYSEPSSKRRCTTMQDVSFSLMDQVAALCTVAGPKVARSAAEAAISALCRENAYARKVFRADNSGTEVSLKPDVCPQREPKVDDCSSPECLKISETTLSQEKNFVHLTFQMRAGIATALGSTAARAKLLADQEDREIAYLMSVILEMQIKKLQSKIQHFEELEIIMETEYIQMQQLKNTMLAEWVGILQIASEAGLLKWREQGFSKSLQGYPG